MIFAVKSDDCALLYPNNSPSNFRICFQQMFSFCKNSKISLIQVYTPHYKTNEIMLLHCSLVAAQDAFGSTKKLLKIIVPEFVKEEKKIGKFEYRKLIHQNLETNEFSEISFQITDIKGNLLKFESGTTIIVFEISE